MSDAHKNELARIITFLAKYHGTDDPNCYFCKMFSFGKIVRIFSGEKLIRTNPMVYVGEDEDCISIQNKKEYIYLWDNGKLNIIRPTKDVWTGSYPVSPLRLITPHSHLNPTTWNRIFERVK